MKKTMISLTVAFAAVLLTSDTAEARRRAYVTIAPARVHVVPRVAYRPIHRVFLPATTTYVTPNLVIGPRGHLHYVAPVQPIVVGPYYGW